MNYCVMLVILTPKRRRLDVSIQIVMS